MELNQGAKRFLDRCTTYMKTFVQLASRSNHKVLGFCTTECINSLGNMWEHIKNFHVPHPIQNGAAFTVSMLRDHLREFRLRPNGGDLRGVNQSVPVENTWLTATRKRDDPEAPIGPLPSHSGQFTMNSTTSTWTQAGRQKGLSKCSTQPSMNGNVRLCIWDMHGDATTRKWTMRARTLNP